MGGAFKYSTESPSAKEHDYGHFMAAQIDPDSSEPISTPPVKGIGKQAQDSCSAIDEQEARDGLSVVDILKGPDGLHDFDETADDGQALLSPQEESTLREALFGASAPGRAPDWTGLLDFQPGYLQPSRRNENDGDLRYHYGDIDSQSARALWMDSWNEVLQSYTDQCTDSDRPPTSHLLLIRVDGQSNTYPGDAADRIGNPNLDLDLSHRRQECIAGTYLCSDSLGAAFDGICCATGQVCQLDNSNRPACCPSGAICTGAAPTTAPSAPTAVSYVPNEFFPFPFVAATLDRDECSSAVSQCSRNYQSCVTQLQGDAGFGVTVVVPGGGGTTVAATRPDVGPSATPICSSLSSRACHDLAYDQCAQSTTVNGVVVNDAARPTAACVAGIVAGVGIVILGAV
ncbi:hypothetical protein Cob_v005216 [Colletotrichum orbiculare MAFF 240422]|uniref:Uncharacterized protein n=1 Tax=Colletotrichum orbiculare (strain 104-T / ATCC 96160 / CBS 514.97 / LARS 414 / MAFF 240422) TaxID=1213857 RepID=A0A484FVZ6_COLOR|nr:hypothetical protein Cob_v005216 [Colletotrichum orbiculare MAFF 240422]